VLGSHWGNLYIFLEKAKRKAHLHPGEKRSDGLLSSMNALVHDELL
jgi:hypothetical protein